MSLQFIISGVAYLGIILLAWFLPVIRNVETILPDHDQMKKAVEEPLPAVQVGEIPAIQVEPAP